MQRVQEMLVAKEISRAQVQTKRGSQLLKVHAEPLVAQPMRCLMFGQHPSQKQEERDESTH